MPANVNNPFLKLSKEHRLIFDYIAVFDRLPAEQPAQVFHKVQGAVKFLKRDLTEHFRLEEEVFFPAALLVLREPKIVKAVLELQKDHGRVEGLVRRLEELTDAERPDDAAAARCAAVTEEFCGLFKNHARVEIEKFFPLLDQNAECRELVNKIFGRRSGS